MCRRDVGSRRLLTLSPHVHPNFLFEYFLRCGYLFYPPDGLEVKEPTIAVVGGTSPDAVAGVNGTPVDVNALGIFSTTAPLEQGANLIEVVATDIQGNIRFQTVVVFYLP